MVRLSDVLLEQVTAQEFARLNEFWYGKPLDGDFNPVRILRPLTFGSYRTLVLEFLDFQYSDKICVYNNKWAHYIVKRMNKKDVQKVCKTAKLDKVKRGHLEVHLNGGIMYPTVLRFSEQNDTIVNYEVFFTPVYGRQFGWRKPPQNSDQYSRGLWVPTGQVGIPI